MFVRYNNDQLYEFKGLTEDQYSNIIQSSSVGKAVFATGIKGVKVVEPTIKDGDSMK